MNLYFSKKIISLSILSLSFAIAPKLQAADELKPLMPVSVPPVQYEFLDTLSDQGRALTSSLDSFFRIQLGRGFNGSVLVGYQGKVLYRRYYGVANRESNLKWDRNTASQLASASKPFTAVAALWLAQNGYLNIDATVKSVLKDFPYENITIRMLMCHRSGMQDYTKMGLNYWRKNDLVMYNEDLLQMFAKHRPALRFTPNSKFEYCNTNYAILARIVEEVAQMDFGIFMDKFIFKPLGMNNTFVYDPLQPMPVNRSQGYKANWSIHGDMFADGVTGDKGIFSTVEDMYKWDQSFYNNTILNKKFEQLSYTPQNELKGERNYGLGWRMLLNKNSKLIFHNGNWHSNNVLFYRFIEDNFTIVILGNKYNTGIYQMGKPIFNIVKQYEKINTQLDNNAE